MRVGAGISRSEPDRCYRGNNRVILDRAYGKAALLIQGNVDYGISDQLSELLKCWQQPWRRDCASRCLGRDRSLRCITAKRWMQ